MEAAPFTFAAGAAPPLDLSLDEIIKQRKKSEPKKAKPGAAKQATPGKKGKPQAVTGKKAVVQGMAVKGQAKRQAVLAKKRGMGAGAVAMAVDRARKVGAQPLKKMAKIGVPVGRKAGKGGVVLKGKKGVAKRAGGAQPQQGGAGGLKFAAGTLKVSIANSNASAKPQQGNGGGRHLAGGNRGKGKGRGGGPQQPNQSRAAAGAGRQKQGRAAQVAARRGVSQPAAGGRGGGKQGQGGKGGRGGRGGERVTIGGARF